MLHKISPHFTVAFFVPRALLSTAIGGLSNQVASPKRAVFRLWIVCLVLVLWTVMTVRLPACLFSHVCDWYIFFFFACHSALRLFGQEPEPSQATDTAEASYFLCRVLGVGCHYFLPPLDIPSFAARYLHVCTTWEILVAKGGTMGENISR